jgi:hypothetical protein
MSAGVLKPAVIGAPVAVGVFTLPHWVQVTEPWLHYGMYVGTGLVVLCRVYLAIRDLLDRHLSGRERVDAAVRDLGEI